MYNSIKIILDEVKAVAATCFINEATANNFFQLTGGMLDLLNFEIEDIVLIEDDIEV